jgi:hypothetical protein
MAIAIVQSITNGCTSNVTTADFAVAPTSGNLLLALVSRRDNPGIPEPTVDTPGWTAVGAGVGFTSGISTRHCRAFYKTSDGTEHSSTQPPATIEFDGGGYVITLVELSGAAYGGVFGSQNQIASTTNMDAGGSVTPAAGTDVLIYGVGTMFATTTVTADGSVTEVVDCQQNTSNSPTHWVGHLTVAGASGSYIVGGTSAASSGYCGYTVVVEEVAAVLPTCDAPVALDVYAPTVNSVAGLTYKATLCGAFDVGWRPELDGTGSVTFKIDKNDADATADILGDGDGDVRYIKVRVPAIQGDPIFGGWLTEGDFTLLGPNEQGEQVLKFGGPGPLGYLDFAKMATDSYITGGHDPYGGLWRLYLAGTGSKPGQMFRRIIEEAQDADRPQLPLTNLTIDFDYTNDSTADPWDSSSTTDEFSAAIGESLLSVAGRLIGTRTLTIQCDPDLLLSAYNLGNYGTDRSSATFAAGKVRLVAVTNIGAATDSPGPKGITRQVRPGRVATHAWVYGENEGKALGALADAASRVTRETFLSAYGQDATALDAIGDAYVADQLDRSESISVPLGELGNEEAAGKYLPGPPGSSGHFWVGDTITLHTGTGEFDYNNASFVVAAINFHQPSNAKAVTDLDIWVELGSLAILPIAGSEGTGSLVASPGGGGSSIPPHFHPAVAAGPVAPLQLGNLGATETLNAEAREWQRGTLDQDCTITVTGFTLDEGRVVQFGVSNDGGFGITWDADVVFADDDQPAQTAGDVTWYLLWSDEGDSVVYGAKVGGTALTVEDEGTPLATAATTLDFVGAGVTASGTGAEKTITIPGGAADLDGLSDVTITSAITGDMLRYNGSAWVNTPGRWEVLLIEDGSEALQTEDGLDWLYVWVDD